MGFLTDPVQAGEAQLAREDVIQLSKQGEALTWSDFEGYSFTAICFGCALMFLGTLRFEFLPAQMLRTFSQDPLVIQIGIIGFRIIILSFIPLVTSLIFPVFF